jgi:hypothetical protein
MHAKDKRGRRCYEKGASKLFLRTASTPFVPSGIVGRDRLAWHRAGDILSLRRGRSAAILAAVETDPKWAGMFRVRCGGELSDMVNLTRAKDAAVVLALRSLNSKVQEKPPGASGVRDRRSKHGGQRHGATRTSALCNKPPCSNRP